VMMIGRRTQPSNRFSGINIDRDGRIRFRSANNTFDTYSPATRNILECIFILHRLFFSVNTQDEHELTRLTNMVKDQMRQVHASDKRQLERVMNIMTSMGIEVRPGHNNHFLHLERLLMRA
jgi:hypothetical protein